MSTPQWNLKHTEETFDLFLNLLDITCCMNKSETVSRSLIFHQNPNFTKNPMACSRTHSGHFNAVAFHGQHLMYSSLIMQSGDSVVCECRRVTHTSSVMSQ